MVAQSCVGGAKNRLTIRQAQKRMQLFQAAVLLEFIAINILDKLRATKRQNQFLLVINDEVSKLLRTVSLLNISTRAIDRVFKNKLGTFVRFTLMRLIGQSSVQVQGLSIRMPYSVCGDPMDRDALFAM